MKTVTYTKAALKILRRIPTTEAKRIIEKVEQYAADPASQANNVKKLLGREEYRLRVGDWRVIFTEDGVVLTVYEIGARGGIYKH